MPVSDRIAARVRTAWPMLLGYLAARLLDVGAPVADWLTVTLGVTVTEAQVAAVLGLVLGYGVYEAGRWLEQRTGVGRPARLARLLGRALLSLGLHTGQPTYLRRGGVIRSDYTPRWAQRP
ncbi:hypothetical protein [Micromonospora thermarum]|uniref:Uncharacterized protein n=1 Tax=Micromonospora thermarum TaxID=2720024 RepID=A0ABX0ZCI9_9ACTN|nr:hypothetical protein [Micromonospora thermarum]NJP33675.1 hypothetical protein [Micromonospora thermarum]